MNQRKKRQNERKQEKKFILDDKMDIGRFFELATSNKKYVYALNLHETINEVLLDYRSHFELNVTMVIEPVEHKTNIRYRNIDDFETYINSIDIDYNIEDVTFTGYVYKLNTPQINIVKRTAYAEGTIYMQEIVEYQGQTVKYQLLDYVLSNVIFISLKKTIQKNFSVSIESKTSITSKGTC